MALRPLQPFSPEPHLQEIALACAAVVDERGILRLQYRLSGPLQSLALPPATPEPGRRDGLWESTCFEAFFGQAGQPNYWEINLGPSGDWNLYALSDYRTSLRQEERVSRLPFQQVREPVASCDPTSLQHLDLELVLDLRGLLALDGPLELSATAVLDHRSFGCSYWAWRHTGPEADFHRRDSFLPL